MSIASARRIVVDVAEPRRSAERLLRSQDNPEGWAIEDLLAQVRTELGRQLLALDGRHEKSAQVLNQYQKVVSSLYEAEGRLRALPRPEALPSPYPGPPA
jgi:hypothetical protein